MKISRLTDYAIVLTSWMAGCDEPRPHKVAELSERTSIPRPTVSKVLKQLARHGVLRARRGANGGYRLARPAAQITVADVIGAMEGPLSITDCADADAARVCEYEDSCGVRANWQRIGLAVQRALASITLADMALPSLPHLIPLRRPAELASDAT